MFILRYNDKDKTTDMTVSASMKKLREVAVSDGYDIYRDTANPYHVCSEDGVVVGVIGKVQVAS